MIGCPYELYIKKIPHALENNIEKNNHKSFINFQFFLTLIVIKYVPINHLAKETIIFFLHFHLFL